MAAPPFSVRSGAQKGGRTTRYLRHAAVQLTNADGENAMVGNALRICLSVGSNALANFATDVDSARGGRWHRTRARSTTVRLLRYGIAVTRTDERLLRQKSSASSPSWIVIRDPERGGPVDDPE